MHLSLGCHVVRNHRVRQGHPGPREELHRLERFELQVLLGLPTGHRVFLSGCSGIRARRPMPPPAWWSGTEPALGGPVDGATLACSKDARDPPLLASSLTGAGNIKGWPARPHPGSRCQTITRDSTLPAVSS